jgi:hypothetical protein
MSRDGNGDLLIRHTTALGNGGYTYTVPGWRRPARDIMASCLA